MRWKIVLEGTDEFGSAHRSELTIDKDLERLSAGEIGFSVEDGKAIMAHLQQVVVTQQCEAYVFPCLSGSILGFTAMIDSRTPTTVENSPVIFSAGYLLVFPRGSNPALSVRQELSK
jgi:hypothetical protein